MYIQINKHEIIKNTEKEKFFKKSFKIMFLKYKKNLNNFKFYDRIKYID